MATQSLMAKLLVEGGMPPVEAVFWRCAIAVLILSGWIQARGRWRTLLSIRRPWLLAGRTVVGNAGLAIVFTAFALLPLAEATVILFTAVLMAPLLARAFLGERMGSHRWAAIGMGFCGVLVAAGPSWSVAPLGVAVALAGAASNAGVKTFLRALKGECALACTFWFLAGGAALSAAASVPFGFSLPSPGQAPLLLILGVVGVLAQLCMTMAFARAPTGVVAPLDYTALLWAAAFDVALWGIVPGWPVFAGGAIIAAASIYLLRREAGQARLRAQE